MNNHIYLDIKDGDVIDTESILSSNLIIRKDDCTLDEQPPKPGFVYLIKPDIQDDEFDFEDFYILSAGIKDGWPYVYRIPTDDLYTAFWELYHAMDADDGVVMMNQERLDYLQTIIEFKEGKFIFKGEDNG